MDRLCRTQIAEESRKSGIRFVTRDLSFETEIIQKKGTSCESENPPVLWFHVSQKVFVTRLGGQKGPLPCIPRGKDLCSGSLALSCTCLSLCVFAEYLWTEENKYRSCIKTKNKPLNSKSDPPPSVN